MLDKIREGSKGPVAQVILGLIIVTFAISGVSSYFGNNSDQSVATVNGEEISRAKFEQSYQNERARMEQQFGEMFASLASNPEYMQNFRNSVLDRLIDETLIKQQSGSLGLTISDDFLIESIRKMPEFQVDGAFNNDRYLALLRQNNLSANQFRDLLRDQFSRNQLVAGLAGSEFALPGELKALIGLQQQTRDIEYALIKAADQVAAVEVDDDKLNSWYQSNQSRYTTPEQVAVEYVELDVAELAKSIKVSDSDIEEYYHANLNRYQEEERRRVSHILLESADDDSAVKAKAEDLLKQLKAGADFATLAKAHSADTVSAEQGGDLDFITKGVMEPEFEAAMYALAKVGDVTDVVKTSFGYHIVKLTAIEAAKVKQLDEVRAQIETAVQTDKAAEKFAELQQKLAEVSFEIADNLTDAANAVGAKVQHLPLFSRDSVPAALNIPRFVDLVFSSDFIAAGTNSDVIDLGNSRVLVARLVEHQAAKNRSFEEVKAEVQAAYIAQESASLAKAKAEALLAELQAGKAIPELVAAQKLTLEKAVATPRFGGNLDAQIRTKAFAMAKPVADNPVSMGTVELATGDSALVFVSKVTDIPVTTEPAAADLARFAEQIGQSHFAAVQKALRDKSEINRRLPTVAAQDQ